MPTIKELKESDDPLAYWWDNLSIEEIESHLSKIGKTIDDHDYNDIKDCFNNEFPEFWD